jgi:hypothetical protein
VFLILNVDTGNAGEAQGRPSIVMPATADLADEDAIHKAHTLRETSEEARDSLQRTQG